MSANSTCASSTSSSVLEDDYSVELADQIACADHKVVAVDRNDRDDEYYKNDERDDESSEDEPSLLPYFEEITTDEKPVTKSSDSDFLIWRLPPDESFSDWTIEIIAAGGSYKGSTANSDEVSCHFEDDARRYHVHRSIIGVGPRRCECFIDLMKKTSFQDSRNYFTRITLPRLAASALPAVLDFIYSRDKSLTIDTNTATALHFLGKYLEIPELRWEAKMFLGKDICLSNVSVYYEHSKVLRDEEVLGALVKLCAEKFSTFDASTKELFGVDIDFVERILRQLIITDTMSEHASVLLSSYFEFHKKKLDFGSFLKLTDEKYLPKISPLVAAELLQFHEFFEAKSDSKLKGQEGRPMTSIQCRCVDALAANWRALSNIFGGAADQILAKVPRDVCPMLLSKLTKRIALDTNFADPLCPHCGPSRILVDCAGSASLNGVYYHQQHSKKSPCLFSRHSRKKKNYHIQFVEKDQTWQIFEDCSSYRVVYYTCFSKEGSVFPPQDDWQRKMNGKYPAPELEFLPHHTPTGRTLESAHLPHAESRQSTSESAHDAAYLATAESRQSHLESPQSVVNSVQITSPCAESPRSQTESVQTQEYVEVIQPKQADEFVEVIRPKKIDEYVDVIRPYCGSGQSVSSSRTQRSSGQSVSSSRTQRSVRSVPSRHSHASDRSVSSCHM